MVFQKREKGQTIIIITISMFVMVIMAALVIDGGNAYLNRRNAQTAADAAALAGAYEYCLNDGSLGEGGSVETVIIQYALTENNASQVDSWELNGDGEIVVTVSATDETFFARVFGQETTIVRADASAGCFPPGVGSGILPIAWACHNPGEDDSWDSGDCEYKALEWITELKPLIDGSVNPVNIDGVDYPTPHDFGDGGSILPQIYVIMDSGSLPEGIDGICQPDGNLICDIDGDGKDDFQGNGDISWLDLDGGGGSVDPDWITDGFEGTLRVHQWIPSQTGVLSNLFNSNGAIPAKVGQIVTLPVFNQHCIGKPISEACIDAAHVLIPPPIPPDEDEAIGPDSPSTTYYHIAGFGLFYISCAHGPGTGDCPGHAALVDLGVISDNTSTVEGYFVTGYPIDDSGVGTTGVDLGIYVISLTE